jgi:hypothetical protein
MTIKNSERDAHENFVLAYDHEKTGPASATSLQLAVGFSVVTAGMPSYLAAHTLTQRTNLSPKSWPAVNG